MVRRNLSLPMALVFFALASFVQAEQPKQIPVIGYLSVGSAATDTARAEGIRLASRKRGFMVIR